jgi:hypothetical protein
LSLQQFSALRPPDTEDNRLGVAVTQSAIRFEPLQKFAVLCQTQFLGLGDVVLWILPGLCLDVVNVSFESHLLVQDDAVVQKSRRYMGLIPPDFGELAQTLSEILDPVGWHANFTSNTETYVIFPGRVFRYKRGDPQHRAETQAHGRTLGIPAHQLEWIK